MRTKEQTSAQNRSYHARHREQILARQVRVRREKKLGPDARHWHLKKLLADAKRRAAKKGIAFDLSVADVAAVDACPVFGVPLAWGNADRRTDNSPSIDRIDSRRGYVKSNVWVISWRANQIKGDATPRELRVVGPHQQHERRADRRERSPGLYQLTQVTLAPLYGRGVPPRHPPTLRDDAVSAHQHYELLCDHEGCEESINLGEARADITRREAAKQGWVHGVVAPNPRRGGPSRSLDFCPVHAADLPEDDAKPSVVALLIEPTGVRWRFVDGEHGVEMQRRTRQGQWRWIMDVCSEPSNLVPTSSAALDRTVENLKRRPLPRVWRRIAS